ncbi:MAG: EF-hand domain-containing protein [Polaromonas sp.]
MPNFELRSVLLFSALAMGMAIASHAQSWQPSPGVDTGSGAARMARADTVEVMAANQISNRQLDAAFNRADTNGDGRLSREEARHFPAIEPGFDQLDLNHDHFISRDEFMKAAGPGS